VRTHPSGLRNFRPGFDGWPGDHGDVLLGSLADAAGTESDSSFVKLITAQECVSRPGSSLSFETTPEHGVLGITHPHLMPHRESLTAGATELSWLTILIPGGSFPGIREIGNAAHTLGLLCGG
jgi:hypothetical protein